MKIETGWVKPPMSIGGLDHLGTQAPCVLIYSQLLPGITNVTDRARYYSLYPWIVWAFDQRYPKNDHLRFVEFFRRADCLFTLISERHARLTDHDNERHGIAMVGRNQLVQALDLLQEGHSLRLSEYTAHESPSRYFKNSMGGLGQYYAGTLSNLNLMDASAKPWIKYTKEFGAPLAEHVNANVPAAHFWDVIECDIVSLSDLDALEAFCACQLLQSVDECQTLTDLYFDRNYVYGHEGQQRKQSLGLILNLAYCLGTGQDLTEAVFRGCTYSGKLPGGITWPLPDSLKSTLACWSIYERNDLLSVACQTVLGVALRILEPQDISNKTTYLSVENFAEEFSTSATVMAIASKLEIETFGDYIDHLAVTAPPIGSWEDEAHEFQVALRMMTSWTRGSDTEILLELSVRLLALLSCRDDVTLSPYEGLAIPLDALTDYPINLISFRARTVTWRPMTFSQVISDLITWCLNTHLRVALRKLRQTGRSTFHMRPSERGLEVVGVIPPPANTTPRFRQAVQILRDIGALTRDNSTPNLQTRVSAIGMNLMKEACV